ncbi:MAG: phospholipid carrier-dependent glycosyltransferase, partial [Clostridia bacterium]|nr:phospholipid carrier-dependent glycosyltransferase [Clostridia bacterium]
MNSNATFNEARKNRVFFPVALAMLVAACLLMLFYRGISDPSEGRYAEVPREMVESGRWLEMRLFGYYYYEKPPLAYWTIAPAIMLFGAHDWAVRVPLFINAALIILFLYLLTRKYWKSSRAFLSIVIASATVGFIGGMCILLTDPFLTTWFIITCACLFWGFSPGASHKHRAFFLIIASLAAFLGFMTKGAVAVVLPGAIIIIWLLWEKRASALLTPGLPLAALLFIAMLAPALWLVEQHNPGFVRHFIYEEHIARFTGTRSTQLHEEPFWFYV